MGLGRARRYVETEEQCKLVAWFDIQYPGYKALLHFTGGGLNLSIQEAARFKRMGYRAGTPDLSLYLRTRQYGGLCLELKTLIGPVSAAQRDMIALLNAEGYRAVICRGFDEAREELTAYINLYLERVGNPE